MYVPAAFDIVVGIAGLSGYGKNSEVDGSVGVKLSTPVQMMYVLWG